MRQHSHAPLNVRPISVGSLATFHEPEPASNRTVTLHVVSPGGLGPASAPPVRRAAQEEGLSSGKAERPNGKFSRSACVACARGVWWREEKGAGWGDFSVYVASLCGFFTRGFFTWLLCVASLRGFFTWLLYVASLRGFSTWLLYGAEGRC